MIIGQLIFYKSEYITLVFIGIVIQEMNVYTPIFLLSTVFFKSKESLQTRLMQY